MRLQGAYQYHGAYLALRNRFNDCPLCLQHNKTFHQVPTSSDGMDNKQQEA